MAAGGLNVPGMFAVDMKSSTRKTFRFWDGIPSEVTEAAEQLKERERLIKDWAAIGFLCGAGLILFWVEEMTNLGI